MKHWLQLRLDAPQHEQEALEAALFACGAAAVSLEDDGDEPLFEQGQTWLQGIVVALFDADLREADILAQLKASAPFSGTPCFERIEEQDWVALTQAQFQPKAFGARLWIMPSWSAPPAQAQVLMRLDPGQAFGTGAHPTTSLCLRWLDAHVQGRETVVDYGCGSGILAIAALLLGASQAYGVDTDPAALDVARENARLNGVLDRLWLGLPEAFAQTHGGLQADVLVANILAGPLRDLAPVLGRHCRSGGHLVLSGILAEQAESVTAAYQQDFDCQPPIQEAEWVRLDALAK